MRERLSSLITRFAVENENAVVLSGDHGYALFDEIRKTRPTQFINVGVMEQAMIGLAAGLAKTGHKVIVYGLSAFVPIRVLEQIKLDLCLAKLPVILLGDGAGLIYSTLGASHQAAEDVAALRPLPNLNVFSPADEFELEACFLEATRSPVASYLRIGKSDRPAIHVKTPKTTEPILVSNGSSRRTLIVSTGAMSAPSKTAAEKHRLDHYSIPRIKPFPKQWLNDVARYEQVIVAEEHSRYGGLCSAILDGGCELGLRLPTVVSLSLNEIFSDKCGSYQYALSEHGLDDVRIAERFDSLIRI